MTFDKMERADLERIAADLLTNLETVLDKMPYGANWDSDGNNPAWLKEARAAIKRAKGQTPTSVVSLALKPTTKGTP